MTTIPVTDTFRPPFTAMDFGDGSAVIDANGEFPAPHIIDLGQAIEGYAPDQAAWSCTADADWCAATAALLTEAAS